MVDIDRTYRMRAIENTLGFSQAVRAGDFLFISGSVSWDQDGNATNPGDMAGQMRAIYADVGKTLKHHGLDPNDVVKETIFVTDFEQFFAGASARAEFYHGLVPPAATAVEVRRLVNPEFLIEIEVTAFFNR